MADASSGIDVRGLGTGLFYGLPLGLFGFLGGSLAAGAGWIAAGTGPLFGGVFFLAGLAYGYLNQ